MSNSNFWEKPDLLVLSGSRLYGCNDENSDHDLKGFVVAPAPYLLGREKFEQFEEEDVDTIVWGLQKFLNLMTKGSPNAFEILFAPDEFIQEITPAGRLVVDNRQLFMGINQLSPVIGYSRYEWQKALLLQKDKKSSTTVGLRKQAAFQKYGYCPKNAYHAIRILHQGIELAKHQHITFPRPEVETLIMIRNGEIPFAELEVMFESLHAEFTLLTNTSTLPEMPSLERINQLYYDIINEPVSNFLENTCANTIS